MVLKNMSPDSSYPSYLPLSESGKLRKIVQTLNAALNKCTLCPRECGVNRLADEIGVCATGRLPMVSSYSPHFGEERPLVGKNGSGTIFMSNCNLKCIFCQNYMISHRGEGKEVPIAELADYMVYLQGIGCHNINFVTPTHVIAQIASAVEIAVEKGLRIPLVYNCGGYESTETLRTIDGIFDIYMPDIKYSCGKVAQELSKAKDYPSVVKAAVKEMYRQVGKLVIDKRGIATRGLLVRHLVLPGNLAGTKDVLHFPAHEISLDTYLNLMDQYRPCYKAFEHPPLDRAITHGEFKRAIDLALEFGFRRIDSVTI